MARRARVAAAPETKQQDGSEEGMTDDERQAILNKLKARGVNTQLIQNKSYTDPDPDSGEAVEYDDSF